jgi:hypothetical protein
MAPSRLPEILEPLMPLRYISCLLLAPVLVGPHAAVAHSIHSRADLSSSAVKQFVRI